MQNRIANLQRSLRERGRIRLGVSEMRNGRKVPKKLDRFLFSAPDEETVQLAAALYGGQVEPWAEGGHDRFRVISDVDSVPAVFPAQMSFSQLYEQWAGGFCTKRCDGDVCLTPGQRSVDERPCECDPDPTERECNLTTQLSVILPDLPGLGVWRLVSHGYYAAVELRSAVELIESAMAAGARVPVRLFLDRREVKRLVNGKPQVRKYVVPVIDLNMSVAALGAGPLGAVGALGAPTPVALPSGTPTALQGPSGGPTGWRPVDQAALAPAPTVTLAEQLAANHAEPKRRANAAPIIRPTGVEPRTADAAAEGNRCSLCGNEYAGATLRKNPEPGGSKYVHADCLTQVADEDPDPAASQEQDGGGGRGGTSGGDAPAEPSSAVKPAKRAAAPALGQTMSHAQHKKLMALAAEAWPKWEGSTGAEVDEYRRNATLTLGTLAGQACESRSEFTKATANQVIDAMERIAKGDLVLTPAGDLVSAEAVTA